MHSDARSLPDGTEIKADLCIIGAGAAGISIAREFEGTKYSVALLEAGGFERESAIQALYEGENIGLPYFPLSRTRLRYFGGTTNHWSGWCSILDPIDFRERDWIPMSGWPITREEIKPYYKRAHPILDLGEYNYDIDYWSGKWWEGFTPLPLEDSPLRTKVFKWSAPTRFDEKYRKYISKSGNITLWTHANVTDIKTPKAKSRVEGLTIECLNGKSHSAKSSQYVLACGGLENPRLLLNSNRKKSDGIGNKNGLVGRYFMEHPHIETGKIDFSEWPDMGYWQRGTGKPFGMISTTPNFQTENKISNYSSKITPNFENIDNKIEYSLKYYLGSPLDFKVSTRIEQVPNKNSKVKLSDEKDELGLNKIKLNWSLTEQETRTIRIASEMLGREIGRLGLGRLQLADWVTNNDETWPDSLVGGHHHMGTTRMSESPEKGVVDSDCKIHGVENLYVAGSSVYPTSGTANPTLTLVALALRISDHLKKQLS
jgi:choline dehydrogenase-like flavoprotein